MRIDIKKAAALFAAGFMTLCSVPFSAAADNLQGAGDDPLTDGSFVFELTDDNTYKITQCTATIVESIPSMRNGTAVTAIGEGAFLNCTAISSLDIPDSVTTIEPRAFYGCASLKNVKLPKKLKSLGEYAFFSCSALESVKLPDTLTEVAPFTFALCDNLENVELPDTITSFGDYAFYQCGKISSFRLPASLKEINDNAMGCWLLPQRAISSMRTICSWIKTSTLSTVLQLR